MESRQPKLRVEGLTATYGKQTALDNVSFIVESGEFLSILGPSGCGKTTLLRILVGLLPATAGRVLMDGIDITSYPPSKRKMGIVFQNYALFENMTVLENVSYALRFDHELKPKASAIAADLLSQVGLAKYAHKRPGALSGGQQQRVAVARTLALNPEVILFDEPMSALDVATRLSLRRELKQIQADCGSTMVYITHDQEEAFAMADRVMVMGEGRIHQLDTPRQIVLHPEDDYVQDFVLKNLRQKLDSLAKFMGPAGEGA